MLIKDKTLDEERALYGIKNSKVLNCRFDGPADGESALKECENITVDNCYFNLRYPFWHNNNTVITNCELTELCRAALWYDEDIKIKDSVMNGIKALRECRKIDLSSTKIISPEFLWRCKEIKIDNCSLQSEYAMFESSDLEIDKLNMCGKYSFQYVENAVLRNCVLDTKDAFWHSKNVTVYDSVVKGEYLGWYSKNLKLVRCKISGTQPLCYCEGLVLSDCTMENTDLSFERSDVNATVFGNIESVKNPACGKIVADSIGEIIMEKEFIDPEKSEIIIR